MIPRIPLYRLRSAARHHASWPRQLTQLNRPMAHPLSPTFRRRHASSTTPPSPPPPHTQPLTTPESPLPPQISDYAPLPPPPPKPRRSIRRYIYATLFFCVGMSLARYSTLIIAPPPFPPPDTPEDDALTAHIHTLASQLPIIQTLEDDPAWTSHDAYTSIPASERPHRLTTGALAGARALGGYQRVFTNAGTGEMISVVYLGGEVCGWPGVVHGGVLATVMDESLGRCAISQLEGNTGVTANLELSYLAPVLSNRFYVVMAAPMTGEEVEAEGGRYRGHARKRWVTGHVETVDGRVCVQAKALFVVPRGYKTSELKDF